MSNQLVNKEIKFNNVRADCENCFGLCCVALPYAKSVDFAFHKIGGTPCQNLQSDYRCLIHKDLRNKGFRGCAVYECFGAGQKVSQITYGGNDWKQNPELANEMFTVFPIMQQLHEMLSFLNEALSRKETQSIYHDLQDAIKRTEDFTFLSPKSILEINVPAHRELVNHLLLKTSEMVREKFKKNQGKHGKINGKSDLIGANLRGADLRGESLRGVLLIASDLRDADMRGTDLIGADLRDADIRGANLVGSIFLTQAQVNSAKGDSNTKLPSTVRTPEHWLH